MDKQQIDKLSNLHKNLVMAFDVQELGDCADELKDILENLRKDSKENSEAIELLEKAEAAIYDVLSVFEEYEISGFFAAVVGNNSELRAIFKENVQFAVKQISEILNANINNEI